MSNGNISADTSKSDFRTTQVAHIYIVAKMPRSFSSLNVSVDELLAYNERFWDDVTMMV